MLFPTDQFAIFFPIVLALSWGLMSRPVLWKPFILVASYVFYACASPIYCLLLGGVTLWNHLAAHAIDRRRGNPRTAAWICRIAVAGNLLNLGFFDYYTFFASSLAKGLHVAGIGMPLPLLTVALPVGISFYTFQAISYTVDVKRGAIAPARLIDTAIYLSFFPHLAAGPIVRAREFLPQLATPRDPDAVAVSEGLMLIGLGLVKKVVIADYLGRAVVDPIYATPSAFHSGDVLLGLYAYAAQIYCDFSGYTDIAIGLALLMGFVFPINFDSPFRATGFRDHWRRWHITLSRFMRDFVYIPLGGNRGSKAFMYRNLLITFVLSGLWHGPAWTFILWGAYNGVFVVLDHWIDGRIRVPAWLKTAVTFHLVLIGYVLFRSQSLPLFWHVLERLGSFGATTLIHPLAIIAIAAAIVPQWLPPAPITRLRTWIGQLEPAVMAGGLVVVILLAAATVPTSGVPDFIYFRF